MKLYFRVIFLRDAEEFMENLDQKTRAKVYFNMRKARHIRDSKLFAPLSGEIWEFRTVYSKQKIRLLAFWDKSEAIDTVVIATHGITKKTSKVPRKEIQKAQRMRTYYFNSKTSADENN